MTPCRPQGTMATWLIFMLALTPRALAVFLPLTTGAGQQWNVSSKSGEYNVAAVVPGTIHLDLMKANIIDEDPLYRYNEKKYMWVCQETWTYTTTVKLTPLADEAEPKGKWLLRFDGIDTVANVTWNGHLLGSSESMFVRYTYEVEPDFLAEDGVNMLEVTIQPALEYIASQKAASAYEIPQVAFYNTWPAGSGSNYIRKTSSDFGWDWGPAFIPAGIVGDVKLFKSDVGELEDILINQSHEKDGSVVLSVTAIVGNVPAETKAHVGIQLTDPQGQPVFPAVDSTKDLLPGENALTYQFTIANPTLWWPAGLGEASLYKLQVTLLDSDGDDDLSQSKTKNVGLRTIKIVEEPVEGSEGLSFYFEVNGEQLYSKGANLIPLHVFYSQATEEEMEWLLQSSVDANMNMVRVWGGGYYQPDAFYDIADRLGLLIWEEIMFACALYPRTTEFLGLVETEVQQQIRRLQSHPSIALWGGNNENEVAMQWFSQSTSNRDLYIVDYYVLYIQSVYKVVHREDPDRAWVDSSPSNGLISRDPYVKRWGNPGDHHYGDLHHYDFDSDCELYTSFPNARFISEFGFQSLPSFETYSEVTSAEDWDRKSDLIGYRQRHEKGNEQIDYMIDLHFRLPLSTSPDNNALEQRRLFDDFLYLSQLQQSRCYETAITNWRRQKATSAKTMGVLYWQLNDVWQGPTWSSIEYGGKWKPLHYLIRRVYSPIIMSTYVDRATGELHAEVTGDLKHSDRIAGTVKVELHAYGSEDATPLKDWTFEVDTAGNSSVEAFHSPVKDLLGKNTPANTFLLMSFTDAGTGLSTPVHVHYFSLFKDANLETAKVEVTGVEATEDPDKLTVTLRSNATALFVFVEAIGFPGWFSDNSFVALAGQDYTLTFTNRVKGTPIDLTKFKASLQVRSLRDTYFEAHTSPSSSAAIDKDGDKSAAVSSQEEQESESSAPWNKLLRGGASPATRTYHERVRASLMRPHTRV